MSGDLRHQLAELRAQLATLQSPTTREQMIRDYFAEPEYDVVRETIVERLLTAGHYSFALAMPTDEDPTGHPSLFIVSLFEGTPRNPQQKVLCYRISYISQWRAHMNAGSGRESIERLRELSDAPEPAAPSVATIAAPVSEPAPEPEPGESEAERLQAKIDELRGRLAVNEAQSRALDTPASPSPHASEPRHSVGSSWAEQMARTRF